MELRDGLFGTPHKIVMDPVHGGIHIFEHEAKIINHPTFQRLRFIVQNDVTSLVFPGATHTLSAFNWRHVRRREILQSPY